MSRTKKEGKRDRMPGIRAVAGVWNGIADRHRYGSTEKILRRNRKLWVHLVNKRRRRVDQEIVQESDDREPLLTQLDDDFHENCDLCEIDR